MISRFKEKYNFLSNFSYSKVEYEGYTYMNVESAFQAQKNESSVYKLGMQFNDPSTAKKDGRIIELRPDWEQVKDNLMYEIVKAKFEQNDVLKTQLLNTNDEVLVEGNTWHDNYWGMCNCERCTRKNYSNNLGKILMRIREELK